MNLLKSALLATAAAVALSGAAEADPIDNTIISGATDTVWDKDDPGVVELSGGIGVVALEANEIVYATPGSQNHLSQLIWQSTAPMLTGSADVALPKGWTLSANAQVAIGGGYMEDYDWMGPFFVSYDFNDWTHRSQHEATNLDWYFDGSILLGRDFAVNDNVSVNLNGGLKYTDVQWTAYGGDLVYSITGFRNDQATIPDSVKGITYRQQFPAVVAGLDTEIVQDQWTFGLSAQGGLTFSAAGTDDHWLRDLRFVDSFATAPLLSIGASADYEVNDNLHLFLAGTAEQIFTARGGTEVYDIPSGTSLASAPDSAGGNLFAASISGGIKGTF